MHLNLVELFYNLSEYDKLLNLVEKIDLDVTVIAPRLLNLDGLSITGLNLLSF